MPSLILPGSPEFRRERPRDLRRSTVRTLGTGLIGYWPFNEGTGATAYDWIGGNNCTLTGAVEWRGVGGDARFAQTPWFDGSNDYGSLALNLAVSTATFSCWFWWDNYANDDDILLELTTIYWQNSGGMIVDPNGSGAWAGNFAVGHYAGASVSVTFTRPTERVWRHLAWKHDTGASSNEITEVFLDGVSQSLSRPENGNNLANLANSTLYIMSRAGSSLFAVGSIAHLAVWSRLLTTDEIVRLSKQPRALMDGLDVRAGKRVFKIISGGITESPASAILNFANDTLTSKLSYQPASAVLSHSVDAPTPKVSQAIVSAILPLLGDVTTLKLAFIPSSATLPLNSDALTSKIAQSPTSAILSTISDALTAKLSQLPAAAILTLTADATATKLLHGTASATLPLSSDAVLTKAQQAPSSAILSLLADIINVGGTSATPASAILSLAVDQQLHKLLHIPNSAILSLLTDTQKFVVTQNPASAVVNLLSTDPIKKLTLLVASAVNQLTVDLVGQSVKLNTPSAILNFLGDLPNLALVVRPGAAVNQLLADNPSLGGVPVLPASAVMQWIVDNPTVIIGLIGYKKFDRISQKQSWQRVIEDQKWEIPD